MHPYLEPLQQRFEANGNEKEALYMKKYMKGQYEYFGIKSPLRREILKNFLSEYGLPPVNQLSVIIKDCWNAPQREYQYFIMEVLDKMARNAEKERIDLYEYMLLNKSWWDTVDYISANLVGNHFRLFPTQIISYTQKWISSGNIWMQRSALLFQLKYRDKTDLDLMTRYIEQLLGSKEFFINKAIGWVLRQHSKTDQDWVLTYVKINEDRLAPLSKREAVKWLERKGEL
jgi:3-methyladenine DNA glycosylase AlkD